MGVLVPAPPTKTTLIKQSALKQNPLKQEGFVPKKREEGEKKTKGQYDQNTFYSAGGSHQGAKLGAHTCIQELWRK